MAGEGEWNGEWSDGDDTNWWPSLVLQLDVIMMNDGRFFMAWSDFCRIFTRVDFCQTFLQGSWYHLQCQGLLNASQCGTSLTNWHCAPKWQLVVHQPSNLVVSSFIPFS